MGVLLWIAAGIIAFAIARIIPLGKRRSWWLELLIAIVIAATLGLLATYLDFGGFRELEWRAALFAFFGALAAVGIVRAL